jgi:hypothetical protein
LQKKKPLIPLKLTDGYEADGWLGLLLGTSMWYALYGDSLSSTAAFEDRMNSLCREIGMRGRADAMATTEVEAEPTVADVVVSDDDEILRVELQAFRPKQLRERAAAEGLDEDAIEDALDADSPKATLINLVIRRIASRGPAARVVSLLERGGEACAEMLTSALEHAMDVLEEVSVSLPRKSRRSLRDVSDRVETSLESVDAEWCDGVARCSDDDLECLSGLIVCVLGLSSANGGPDVSGTASDAVDSLNRCGRIVVQSIGLLSESSGEDGAKPRREGVLIALESLRGLSEARLESVCADEAAVHDTVGQRLSVLDACVGDEAVSGCMALHTLGCRNGIALCGIVEALEWLANLYNSWIKYIAAGGDDYAGGAASHIVINLVMLECGT